MQHSKKPGLDTHLDYQERYELLFENMLSGFALHKIILNKKGEPVNYEFIDMNKVFEEVTGIKRSRAIGKKVTDVIPDIEKDTAQWIQKYGKVALKGKKIVFENYSEPLKKWFLVSAYSPKKGYFVTLFRDITHERQDKEKLEQSNKIKNRFINRLRYLASQPLHEIRWGIELLLSGEFGELTDEQKVFLQRTLNSQEAILRDIRKMQLVLDIDAGTVHYEKVEGSLSGIAASVVDEHKNECNVLDLQCSLKKPKEPVSNVTIDVAKIRMVVGILFDNALQYSPSGGKVTIQILKSKKNITLKVIDEGIGIPMNEQDAVFTQFFRASNAQKKHSEGAGLGLFIVKEVIEAHGGEVGFTSKEGQGSTFWFKLPIVK